MASTSIQLIDGHYYYGDEIPDLGTLVAISTELGGRIRNYEGLQRDSDKLPVYDDLETGSSCFFFDTGKVYKYEKTTRHWGEVGKGGWPT